MLSTNIAHMPLHDLAFIIVLLLNSKHYFDGFGGNGFKNSSPYFLYNSYRCISSTAANSVLISLVTQSLLRYICTQFALRNQGISRYVLPPALTKPQPFLSTASSASALLLASLSWALATATFFFNLNLFALSLSCSSGSCSHCKLTKCCSEETIPKNESSMITEISRRKWTPT